MATATFRTAKHDELDGAERTLLSDDKLSTRFPSPAQTSPRRNGGPLRRHRGRSIGGILLSTALVGAAVLSNGTASAAPKPTIAQTKAAIQKLQQQQEQAAEQFNDTREELKSVNVRLKAAQVKLDRQRVDLKKAQSKMGKLAAETYRRGELSTLDLVLGDDPTAALTGAGYLPSLGQRQSGAVDRLNAGEKKLLAAQQEIKDQQNKAAAAQANLNKTKATVEKKLSDAEAELRKLNAAERAKVLEEVSSSDDPPSGGGGGGGSSGPGGTTSCGGKAVTAATAAGKAAISFACAQLGEPYVWAADGPGSWDCSGLTMKAFAAGGVSLPHSSRLQATYGTRISVSNMQAGDLVFFHSPISHVGIYLGNNTMVHAPNSNTVVKVASLYDTPSAVVRL
jgi:cell wall-associated NlpC family hydrolase